MVVNLSQIKENEVAFISKITGSTHLKRRLLELGFTVGTLIKIVNISPLKSSFLLEIRGYFLALRKNAVSKIFVIKAELDNMNI